MYYLAKTVAATDLLKGNAVPIDVAGLDKCQRLNPTVPQDSSCLSCLNLMLADCGHGGRDAKPHWGAGYNREPHRLNCAQRRNVDRVDEEHATPAGSVCGCEAGAVKRSLGRGSTTGSRTYMFNR